MTSTQINRDIVTAIWAEMADGNGAPFVHAMSEHFTWRMTGTTPWSGVYAGKTDVRERLLKTLFAQYATPYRSVASRIHADDEIVVVECRGQVTTTRGRDYNNTYCFVIRMENGQMSELTEYFDSALVNEALEPPPWA